MTRVISARRAAGVRVACGLALATCLGGVVALAALGPNDPSEPRTVLASLGFTADEIAQIDGGRPLAKLLDTDRREIAVVGAVRILAPRERLIERYEGVEYLRRSAVVLDVGRFSRPPQPDDLRSAPFEEYDLDLRACRPGDCRVRLSPDDIARFHRNVDWSAPDWRDRSAATWRDVLAGYAGAFALRGPAALPVYANKKEPLQVYEELKVLRTASSFVSAFAPEFYGYLADPSRARLSDSRDIIYWSKEDFGVRPVFRVSHQSLYTPQRRSGNGQPPVVVATTQLYADHYLDAALGLTLALDAPGDSDQDGFYMIAMNRARTRSLSGILRTIVRSTVQGRSRDAMLKVLRATKSWLESR